MVENRKMVFAGLDNAGKTSIIQNIHRNFIITKTQPTRGIERKTNAHFEWLGYNLSTWDLGGQEEFRKSHLKNPMLFIDIEVLFYVIDIQDTKRYDLSIDYFQSIMKKFDKEIKELKIIICFNKFDPDLEEKESYESKISKLKFKIQELDLPSEIYYFKTTIYDKSTIIHLFYEGFIKKTPKGELVDTYLKKYAQLTFSSAVVLLDEYSLIVGSQYTKEYYKEICQSIAPWMKVAIDKVERYGIYLFDISSNIQFETKQKNKDARIFLEKIQISPQTNFILIVLTLNKRTTTLNKKYLPDLAEKLTNLMKAITF